MHKVFEAVQNGDIDGIRANLPAAGLQDQNGWSPLMHAAKCGQLECVELLMDEAGLRTTMVHNSMVPGTTALMAAAKYGRADCASLLVSKENCCQDKFGWTALMYAALFNHPEVVSQLVQWEARLVDNNGWSSLMLASLWGHREAVQQLLCEAGLQTRKRWKVYVPGTTALIVAAIRNEAAIVELLRSYEIDLRDSDGHTALWHAMNNARDSEGNIVEGGHPEVIKLLTDENIIRLSPPLLKTKRECLEGPFSPQNVDDNRDNVALSDSDAAELICLRSLVQEQATQILELQRRLGERDGCEGDSKASLDDIDVLNTITVLHAAAINGDSKITQLALQDARKGDPVRRTALMHAAARGYADVVRMLVTREARMQDQRGWTALMYAAKRRHKECVRLLILEKDLKAHDGTTFLDVLRQAGVDWIDDISNSINNAAQLPQLPPTLAGKYTLTGRLGRGVYGNVYAAFGPEDDKLYAIKAAGYQKTTPEEKETLLTTLGTLPTLHHKHVLRYYAVADDPNDETVYLVMDHSPGSLQADIKTRQRLGGEYTDFEVWNYLEQLSDALQYLHENGLVHQDIKPGNVLIDDNGACQLSDSGLAGLLAFDDLDDSTFMSIHMSPARQNGEDPTPEDDVWSLGILLYRLCTGKYPFRTPAAIMTESVPPVEKRDPELIELVVAMLEKQGEKRPTAQELHEKAVKAMHQFRA
ncbi:Kinase, NEK [Giardia muris]|uniref:Kinase, NEK n=1 Tax=Giardia muris TaxID=5742 RepID=A0A4Z1T0I1_GIAMU|nr:Kinase, NEK [Giardia muris]|eukprot:TNJ27413.1 Kinase, NEK [Giardia muris]